jgi:hypothetical protein
MTTFRTLGGLAWLVEARNEIQGLMFRLHQRWDVLDESARQFALGAAFSLWRAVFLIADHDVERRLDNPDLDAHAKRFLERVIRTNAINFVDDLRFQEWSSGYYVNNARYRVTELLTGTPGPGSVESTLREAWNDTFDAFDRIVSGES